MTEVLSIIVLWSMLIFMHVLGELSLRGEFVKSDIDCRITESRSSAVVAHILIQSWSVGLITGSIWLALAELVIHGCLRKFYTEEDDSSALVRHTLHVGSKLIFVLINFGYLT